MEKFDEAESELKKALALDPRHADAHYNLGNVYFLTGRMPEALNEYRTALKLMPDNTSAHNNLGAALEHMGRYAEAAEQFQAALQLDPNNANAAMNLQRAEREAASPPARLLRLLLDAERNFRIERRRKIPRAP